jgi:hypothetical protein
MSVAAEAPVSVAENLARRPGSQKQVTSRTASTILVREAEWLLKGRVPYGALTLLGGQPGLGKSLFTVKLAADLSAGRLGRARDVLMLTAEDPLAEVVVPRLEAAEANVERVHFGTAQIDEFDVPLQLPGDTDVLRTLVKRHAPGLLVVDPLAAHLEGRIDSWKDQSVRLALAPLQLLAEEHKLAVLVVAHLNKGRGTDPVERLGGSIGLPAAARSVLLLGRDPDDPEGEAGNRRVVAQVKSNYGPLSESRALEVEAQTVEGVLFDYTTARIIDRGASVYTGSDLLQPPRPSGRRRSKIAEAEAFLRTALANGERFAAEVIAEAAAVSITKDTLERARDRLDVKTDKQRGVPNGPWIWSFDETTDEARGYQAAA